MTDPTTNGTLPSPTVNDEEGTSETKTINRIQQYRDDIAEYQLLFAQNELTEEISERQQHRSYHHLVRGFVQLLRPYLEDDRIDVGTDYWDGVEIGTFSVAPPAAIAQPDQETVQGALAAGDRQVLQRADPRNSVAPVEYTVRGVRDFYETRQPEWTESWRVMFGPEVTADTLRQEIRDERVRVHPRSHRNEPIEVVKIARVPRGIIDEVVTNLEQFVREIGMDVELNPEPYTGEGGPGL